MKKLILIILGAITFSVNPIFAQEVYFGPRFGISSVSGNLANELENNFNTGPVGTQLGWQHESIFIETRAGGTVLLQAVGLIGGLEERKFLPSGSFAVSYRGPGGTGFGFGPILSLAGPGLVFVIGKTFTSDNVNIPINLMIVPSPEGSRLTLLTGLNIKRKNK